MCVCTSKVEELELFKQTHFFIFCAQRPTLGVYMHTVESSSPTCISIAFHLRPHCEQFGGAIKPDSGDGLFALHISEAQEVAKQGRRPG